MVCHQGVYLYGDLLVMGHLDQMPLRKTPIRFQMYILKRVDNQCLYATFNNIADISWLSVFFWRGKTGLN